MAKLEARSLRKQYRSKLAVESVSLHVSSGEIIGLLGPNGAADRYYSVRSGATS